MKRSNLLLNIISVIILGALAVYIAFSYISARRNTLVTKKAVSDVAENVLSTEGYILRDETPLQEANVCFLVQDGEKVARGQKIAEQYQNTKALERANKIRSLTLQIQQLEEEQETDQFTYYEKAEESVENLIYAFRTGQTKELDFELLQVRTYAFDTADNSAHNREEMLSELYEELNGLRQADNSDGNAITAPCSGVFCTIADGWENIELDSVKTMTPSQLENLTEKMTAGKEASGKIITSLQWYYVTSVPTENCQRLSVGDTVKVRFIHTYSSTIQMTVEALGKTENGSCVAVFSADQEMSETVNLREVTGQLIFTQQEGIRVSRKALHLDEDGNPNVFVLEGTKAVSVSVEILAELEDGDYLVSSSDDADLHEGSEVIVQGRDLFDDKVVLQ